MIIFNLAVEDLKSVYDTKHNYLYSFFLSYANSILILEINISLITL